MDSVLREMDTYAQTIYMVEVFCSCLKKTHLAECRRGHTMHPRDDPARDVRPDFALAGRDLHIIGEAKSNITQKPRGQRDLLDQIDKYCRVLCWPDGQNPVHDVTVLTSMRHVGRLSDLLEERFGEQSVREHKLSVMGFSQEGGAHESFHLKLKWGIFTDSSLTRQAKSGLRVEARNAIVELNKRWFSDSAPPVLYTMSLIWERILPHIIKENPDGADDMEVEYSVTTEIIQKTFEKFSDSAPRRDWIKYAMDALVEIGRAKKNGGSYTVRYRHIRRVRETFAKRWVKRRASNNHHPVGQTRLVEG